MFRVRINDGLRVFEVPGGASLLASLADKGVWLPSICGGSASCGECACVARGEFAGASSVELALLGEDRIARGMRLACSIHVASDIELWIPDEVLALRKRSVRVASIERIARDTREIELEATDGPFDFRPGQYLRVFIPPHGGLAEGFQRAYSFASPPGGTRVSIVVRRTPGGLASVWLHDALAIGDAIDIVGPFGSFSLPEGPSRVVCVAGGTGLAPFFPILSAMEASGELERRGLDLVYGAKERVDLFGLSRLEDLESRVPNFRFLPVLQEPDEAWRGERGFVTTLVESLLTKAGEDAKDWKAAICGSPGMVKACERVLARHGISGEAVRRDSFA